ASYGLARSRTPGGYSTSAEGALGFWMERAFGFARNHYDRIGHFAQGFVPAIIAREVLLRRSPLRPGKWLSFLVLCVCLALSATYEFVEWWSALIGGGGAAPPLSAPGGQCGTQRGVRLS